MSDLFIPSKLRVGFKTREHTYNGKIAYVIYYDTAGKIRKEKSFEGWRDHSIPTMELDNKPIDGFILNKGIQRFNWSHFGSGRSYIRVYDSRGIEFEITPENLLGILTETDCSRRGLVGEFVYAWKGTELVLLPCCSQEYKDAQKYTNRQSQKISARDLKHGCSYTTKKGEEVIYMGRFEWFEWVPDRSHSDYTTKINSEKKHIFAHAQKPDQFFPKGDVSFLATLNNPDPVFNYAELVESWNSNPRSCSIEEWTVAPLQVDANHVFELFIPYQHHPQNQELKNRRYTKVDGDNINFYALEPVNKNWGQPLDNHDAFYLEKTGTLNRRTMTFCRNRQGSYSAMYGWRDRRDSIPPKTKSEIMTELSGFSAVNAVLKNGKKIPMTAITDIKGSEY